MRTIFITISRGSLIRNFFNTGVISRLLDNDFRVVVLTPNYKDSDLFKDYQHENLLFEPLILASGKLKFEKIITEFAKAAIFNRTIYTLYKYGIEGMGKSSKALFFLRVLFLAPLRYLPGFKDFVRWVDFKTNPQKEHDYLFEKYKPDLVFATTTYAEGDVGVLKCAKRFGAKTVQMPKSWDNLSFLLCSVKTDYLFVWGEYMKGQATRLHGYKGEEIVMTGIPQFDYYADKSNLVSRDEFCRNFGLDPDKKIILYGSTGLISHIESLYVELMKQFMDKGLLKNAQILVRPHLGYLKDREGYKYLEERYKDVVVDMTDRQSDKFKDHWDTSFSHLKNLLNSLYHADVCINSASTLTLDAIACGTPVININFCPTEKDKENLVKRFKGLDYVQALMGTGATWLANSKEEFLECLKNVLEKDKSRGRELKEKMIYNFMYKNDGNSVQRIADSLIQLTFNN